MAKYSIAFLVRNQFGVLNRVTSMFRRRQFNIDSLTVSATEDPDASRITVTFEGTERKKDQMVNQLYKLPVVLSIKELDNDSIMRELLLIKMENNAATRADILAAADAFGAKTVGYSRHAIILELTGDSLKLDQFVDLMRDYSIFEICRTGIVSLQRGSDTIGNAEDEPEGRTLAPQAPEDMERE